MISLWLLHVLMIASGVPIPAERGSPEVKRVMESYQLGQVVEESTPQAIASAIVAVCNRPIDDFLPGIKKAQKDFQWQKESGVILKDLKLAGLIN